MIFTSEASLPSRHPWLINPMDTHPQDILVGGIPTPLKILFRQLGLSISQYMEK